MTNSTMTAAPVAEGCELAPLLADTQHPAWCDPRHCYSHPDTGYSVHSWEAPDELINGVSVSFTITRKDSADGPGETRIYIHSVSELEGERIETLVLNDSHETPRKRASVAEGAVTADCMT
jgi:hypothetical protein